jgi:hypothetical protein
MAANGGLKHFARAGVDVTGSTGWFENSGSDKKNTTF